MNRSKSKSLGKKDRPLEKGQQTLSAFFSKTKSLQTLSKCPVCLKQICTPQLAAHQKNCTPPLCNPAFSQDKDGDSDVEIIADTKTPIKRLAPSTPTGASVKGASEANDGPAGSSIGAADSTHGAAGSSTGAADSTNGAAGSTHSTPTLPCPWTPCRAEVPLWGPGSPQISAVVGGAAALCETVWSQSDSASEPPSPQIRCRDLGVGGWLVSPTRSPSVSPSGRVMTSPAASGRVMTSPAVGPAGRLAPPGSRVKLSAAVAGRMGRFAHSALLAGHLPPPTSPAPSQRRNQSPRQGSSRSQSPGEAPQQSPVWSPNGSPVQSPSRRLPKTNPLRYLSSPSSARRRLYRTSSGEALGSTGSAAGRSTGRRTAANTPGRGTEREGEAGGGALKRWLSSDSGSRVNGLLPVKPADPDQSQCTAQERLVGDFIAAPAAAAAPCPSVALSGITGQPPDTTGTPNGRVPPSVASGTVEDRASTPTSTSTPIPTPTRAADLDLSAEDEQLLSQEFSQEMPEVALLSPKKPDAPQAYYLQNFVFVVDSVLSDALHAPLLDDEDRDVIGRFRALPPPAQMLYVRVFQRKHAWIRPDKMRYAEVGGEAAVAAALHLLAAAQLVDTESQLSGAVELAELLAAPELRQLCQQLHLTATGPRPELLARLAQLGKKRGAVMFFGAASPAEVAARRARTLLGRCVRVSAAPRRVLLRVLSLFRLPLYEDEEDTSQQLLTLLMVNLGRMVYPPVTVSKQTAIFGTRDDLLRYEAASQLECQLRYAMERKQWEAAYEVYRAAETMSASLSEQPELERHDAALPAFLRRFTASSIVTYVRSKSVEVLQRRRDHKAAVYLLRTLLGQGTYLPDYHGFWWDRLALTLHQHLKQPAEALVAARDALADPEVRGGHRLALEQRVARLKPALDSTALMPDHLPSVEIEARCLPRDVPGLKMVFLRPERPAAGDVTRGDVTGYVSGGDVTVCSVEELALAHYSPRYSEGVHREGAPTVTIFALLFWDLLYSTPVPDSFRSAYQTLPLDLNSPAFLERRREAVEARLAQLEAETEEEACLRAAEVWERNHGCLSLASWDVFRDREHALGLIRCLGMRLVTAICRRLVTEYRFTRSGFPDLVLWNPADCTARIVEVKGPNDRLSTKQMLWIRYLLDHGATAEVCYVRALGRRGGSKRRAAATSPKKRRPAAADGGDAAEMGEGKRTKRARKTRGATEKVATPGGAGRGRRKTRQAGEGGEDEAVPQAIEAASSGTPTQEEEEDGAGQAGRRGRSRRNQEDGDGAGQTGGRGRRNQENGDGAGQTGGRGRRNQENGDGAGQTGGRGRRNQEDGDAVSGRTKRAKTETGEGDQGDGETSRGGRRTRIRPAKSKVEAEAEEVEVLKVEDGKSGEEVTSRRTRLYRSGRVRGNGAKSVPGSSQRTGFRSAGDSSGSDFE